MEQTYATSAVDLSSVETTPAEPEAGSMIETFRAIGYSLETAVADIIDNSISAGAYNVWVDFDWKGASTWLAIKDDGSGMNNEELIRAMRPGSRNPNEVRHSHDLGRFGLGLKTASFSQCRKLCVISKKKEANPIYWTWDLDYVNQTGKWNLIRILPDLLFEQQLEELESGTTVVWNDIDRLVSNLNEGDKSSLDKFLKRMEQVKQHLAMTFHRYIENNKIKLWFQQREVIAWDPFLINEPATQKFPEEPLQGAKVKLRGYVLPHKSKLTTVKFREAEGPNGWNAHQGFYIYRKERLLLAGDWLGMFRKEEHFKLARIMIDLPNSLDEDWQIDIKKSVARPPLVLRDHLKAYASKVRAQAVEVYRHKGKVLQRKYASVEFQPVWVEKVRHGKRFYNINREHPLISQLLSGFTGKAADLQRLLRLIEETVPVPLITIRESEQPDAQGQPFEGSSHEPVINLMKLMYQSFIAQGKTDEFAKMAILNMEPFNLYPQFIDSVSE
ncbi:histidine kinase/DNA gyrase B/HSP90-like ATPase [Pontibacter mucosus]|uniref:Histidine kinase/DNA gyrase B/HSP90-like ATPase n=1 Tax=Pontibacter mucosus TaxID=1649266 RepID=A0A2T5YDU7_9BACT|nr:ATP-binding protein [Pontibacter mucosus]PTX14725.1 histidine kinase/DNA gyrase B/HSP90-like ATPase [Pontibacter mucosus]